MTLKNLLKMYGASPDNITICYDEEATDTETVEYTAFLESRMYQKIAQYTNVYCFDFDREHDSLRIWFGDDEEE